MSDDDRPEPVERTKPSTYAGRKLYLRRGRVVARASVSVKPEDSPAPAPENDIVLRQLQGIRNELQHMREQQLRDRQLLIKLGERVEQGFENVRGDIKELRSEMLLLENKILTVQNEVLNIVRRIDEAESEPFEIIEADETDASHLPA